MSEIPSASKFKLAQEFSNYLTNSWQRHHAYPELSGTEIEEVTSDEFEEQGYDTDNGGDYVAYDSRSHQGFIFSFEDSEGVFPIALKTSSPTYRKRQIEANRPIQREVSTAELVSRFEYMVYLLFESEWQDDKTICENSFGAELQLYPSEKLLLPSDIHLAFYWLLVFGFTNNDPCYNEVKTLCANQDHAFLEKCLAFFDVRRAAK